MSDATFKGLLIIIGFIICRRILAYIYHKLAIINITYKFKRLIKRYPIITNVKLIEKHPKLDFLKFNVTLDTGILVAETLIGNNPRKVIEDSIDTLIYDLYHDDFWSITVDFIEN